MMDAVAVNRLFLSKKPRIPVIAVAQVFKIFFISADQAMNFAIGAITRCLFDDFEFERVHVNPYLPAAKKIEAGVKIFGVFRDGAGDGELSPVAGAL
jgi:hypothetical protein